MSASVAATIQDLDVVRELRKVQVRDLPSRDMLRNNPPSISTYEYDRYKSVVPNLTRLMTGLIPNKVQCTLAIAAVLKGHFPHYIGPMHASLSMLLHSQHCSYSQDLQEKNSRIPK